MKLTMKFLRPTKRLLKNAQHYSLMEAFKTVLTAAGFSGVKIEALIAAFNSCFGVENTCYMMAKASDVIRRRDEADKLRDKLYTKLHQLVRLWLESGNTDMETAAEALIRVFRLYKLNTQAQIDEETGVMDNLITDLTEPAMQTHIATLGATWLFNQMVQAQTELKAIRLEQGTEVSETELGALAKARKASDAAYDDLINMIEALSLTADDTAPYEAFIRNWNGTLKIYQDMLDRKSGTSTSTSQSGQQGGQTTEPSGGDEPAGDQPGDDNGGGDTPSDPTTPDPSQGGDGGDDAGGDSGDNGDDNGGGDTPPPPVVDQN